jgi:hypothetical protein
MANLPQLGFSPVGTSGRGATRKYTLASGYAPSNGCLGVAPGEVVKVVANNTVAIFNNGDTSGLLGVVASVSYVDPTGVRQFGGYVPTGTTYTGDADVINKFAPYIEVWDDPEMEYLACLNTASATVLTNFQLGFGNMDVTATSATSVDTIYKRSLRSLTGTKASTATLPFRILEVLRSPQQDYTANFLQVKCCIHVGFHAFYNATGI